MEGFRMNIKKYGRFMNWYWEVWQVLEWILGRMEGLRIDVEKYMAGIRMNIEKNGLRYDIKKSRSFMDGYWEG